MKTTVHLGQPSWRFASDRIEALITRLGGQLAPVRFRLGKKTVSPFAVAPWAEEKGATKVPLLQALRGDFFCAPFGGNDEAWRGERHPPHGEPANAAWRFESLEEKGGGAHLHLSLRTRARAGRIDKHLFLRPGETALYCRHILSGMTGRMPLGHHATLKFPGKPGSGRITTSPIRFGQVLPAPFEDPASGGYNSLKRGAPFTRLDRVPMADGGTADLGRYPARRGFEDLAMVFHEARPDFAWTAATFPEEGWLWIALKDPRVLAGTVFWMSNGGRHYAPWSGRHLNVIGLEDVTANFHLGLAPSLRRNGLNRRGFPTALALRKDAPLAVNYIMAVAAIPRGFDAVGKVVPGRGGVTLVSKAGPKAFLRLDTSFLYEILP